MKIDLTQLGSDSLKIITFAIPISALNAIDRAASRADASVPNRSAWIRSAVLTALRKEAHV